MSSMVFGVPMPARIDAANWCAGRFTELVSLNRLVHVEDPAGAERRNTPLWGPRPPHPSKSQAGLGACSTYWVIFYTESQGQHRADPPRPEGG